MPRASKILSLSPLDRFSYGDFFGPLNEVGEDKGLSFRFGGMKFFLSELSKATKSRSSAKTRFTPPPC